MFANMHVILGKSKEISGSSWKRSESGKFTNLKSYELEDVYHCLILERHFGSLQTVLPRHYWVRNVYMWFLPSFVEYFVFQVFRGGGPHPEHDVEPRHSHFDRRTVGVGARQGRRRAAIAYRECSVSHQSVLSVLFTSVCIYFFAGLVFRCKARSSD